MFVEDHHVHVVAADLADERLLDEGLQRVTQEYGDDDVIYLPLPLKAYDLVDTVSDLLTDIHRRLKREREKPNKRSSADQGVINQAKSLLMEKNELTEEEAHRYLQMRSMDNETNMVEAAYMVLLVF